VLVTQFVDDREVVRVRHRDPFAPLDASRRYHVVDHATAPRDEAPAIGETPPHAAGIIDETERVTAFDDMAILTVRVARETGGVTRWSFGSED